MSKVLLVFLQDKEGRNVDFSSGMVVRSLSKQADYSSSEETSNAPAASLNFSPVNSCLPEYPQVNSSQIHNLQIGGNSFLVSTPFGDGPQGMEPVNGQHDPPPEQLQQNCFSTTDIAEDLEAMNISPRPNGNEMSPRDMDI